MFVTADLYHKTSSSIAFLLTNVLDPILKQLKPIEKIKHYFKANFNIGLPNRTGLWRGLFNLSDLLKFLSTSHLSLRPIW
jgi:hypothetical protein